MLLIWLSYPINKGFSRENVSIQENTGTIYLLRPCTDKKWNVDEHIIQKGHSPSRQGRRRFITSQVTPNLVDILIFPDTFSLQAREIRWEMDLHIHALWSTVSRDHEERRARTSAALGSVATTTKLPYTHEPILCANVVEGDYLRPCISTLSDDQTTKISVPVYWSAVKCCTFFFFYILLQNYFLNQSKKRFFFYWRSNKNKSIDHFWICIVRLILLPENLFICDKTKNYNML